jgi:hypothetical protein
MATPRNWLDTSGPMDTYAVIWSCVGLGHAQEQRAW